MVHSIYVDISNLQSMLVIVIFISKHKQATTPTRNKRTERTHSGTCTIAHTRRGQIVDVMTLVFI